MISDHNRRAVRHEWIEACCACNLDLEVVEAALSRYEELGRHYHNLDHILNMFLVARDHGVSLSTEQTIAVLFHDAIYVPGAKHGANEEMSALLMRQLLNSDVENGHIPKASVEKAAQIIHDTIHHRSSIPESSLVLDLDLSGLGQGQDRFDADSRNVFLENEHLIDSWDDFCIRRADFMANLAARDRIYHTDTFAYLEAPARANIERVCANRPNPKVS